MSMGRKQQVVALILIAAIGLVLLLPSIDLLPTAMRASRSAKLIVLALAMAAVYLVGVCEFRRAYVGWPSQRRRALSAGLIDLTCARLC